jgi:glycosyltransferase involved in cell wall biosynthesis
MNEIKLTLSICSNSIEKLIKHTLPVLREVKSLCAVQIYLDSSIKDDLHSFLNQIEDIKKISDSDIVVISQNITGLSNLRNIVLKNCQTKYLLFIDDDITIGVDAVKSIINELENNYDIVGLRLTPSENIEINKYWYIAPNQYHYLGIHTEYTSNTIWGACMAFNMKTITEQNIFFNAKLGRQNNQFLSGEETDFIAQLTKRGCQIKMVQSNYAIHHIEPSRLTFLSLLKRVFWQGITEVMRDNIPGGFNKEFKRNFQIINYRTFLFGFFWMQVFCMGLIFGMWHKKRIISSWESPD